MERYGSSEPLPYDLSMVRAPVVIFSADTDPFAPDEVQYFNSNCLAISPMEKNQMN